MSGVQITLRHQLLLFGQYCETKRPTFTPEESSQACEAERRFRQLELFLGRICKLELQFREVFPRREAHVDGSKHAQEAIAKSVDALALSFELITFVEAFYYFAWRLREVLRQLPGLKKFDAPGIRYVRNNLIEHPEKHLLRQAFAFNPERGPVLKPINMEQRDPEDSDKGLWENVRELQEVLDRSLSKAAKHTRHM